MVANQLSNINTVSNCNTCTSLTVRQNRFTPQYDDTCVYIHPQIKPDMFHSIMHSDPHTHHNSHDKCRQNIHIPPQRCTMCTQPTQHARDMMTNVCIIIHALNRTCCTQTCTITHTDNNMHHTCTQNMHTPHSQAEHAHTISMMTNMCIPIHQLNLAYFTQSCTTIHTHHNSCDKRRHNMNIPPQPRTTHVLPTQHAQDMMTHV